MLLTGPRCISQDVWRIGGDGKCGEQGRGGGGGGSKMSGFVNALLKLGDKTRLLIRTNHFNVYIDQRHGHFDV